MKIIFCLAVFAVFSLTAAGGHHHQQKNALRDTVAVSTTPNIGLNERSDSFFLGQWYPVKFDEARIKKEKCCMPVENIRFVQGPLDFLVLQATKWVGNSCSGSFSFEKPVQSEKFGIMAETNYYKVDHGYTNSDKGVQLDAKKISINEVHRNNGTQKVTFDLSLNYKIRGGSTCTMTLSKVDTPVVQQSKALRGSPYKIFSDDSDDDDDSTFVDFFDGFFKRPSGDIFWD